MQKSDYFAPAAIRMLQALNKVFDNQLKEEKVKNLINDKQIKFDLLLLEAFFIPTLAFSHIYKVPVIQMSAFGAVYPNYESVNVPAHTLLYPTYNRAKLNNLPIWKYFTELCYIYKMNGLTWESWETLGNRIIREHFGSYTPQVSELLNNIDMLFLNIHPEFEDIRDALASVVYMGGLHRKPIKELPKDLKSYLDSSKHGVIYISFGTNIDPSLIPPEKIQTLIRVISQLPYDVLWKWNKDELPGRIDNIQIFKWLPQSDLLKHKKIKLFITQGGLQSRDEAIAAGVPLNGMPMTIDQCFNVDRCECLGIGVRVDMETPTEEKLLNAINRTIGDEMEMSYRRNMEHLISVMQDSPDSQMERAVWWTEYVLRHGGGAKHYYVPNTIMEWYDYLELKLALAIFMAFLITFIITFISSITLLCFRCRSR